MSRDMVGGIWAWASFAAMWLVLFVVLYFVAV